MNNCGGLIFSENRGSFNCRSNICATHTKFASFHIFQNVYICTYIHIYKIKQNPPIFGFAFSKYHKKLWCFSPSNWTPNIFLLGFLERNQQLCSCCQVGRHVPVLNKSKGSLSSRPVLPLFMQYHWRERENKKILVTVSFLMSLNGQFCWTFS